MKKGVRVPSKNLTCVYEVESTFMSRKYNLWDGKIKE